MGEAGFNFDMILALATTAEGHAYHGRHSMASRCVAPPKRLVTSPSARAGGFTVFGEVIGAGATLSRSFREAARPTCHRRTEEEERRRLRRRLESRISPEDALAAIRERRDEGKLAAVIQIDPSARPITAAPARRLPVSITRSAIRSDPVKMPSPPASRRAEKATVPRLLI